MLTDNENVINCKAPFRYQEVSFILVNRDAPPGSSFKKDLLSSYKECGQQIAYSCQLFQGLPLP